MPGLSRRIPRSDLSGLSGVQLDARSSMSQELLTYPSLLEGYHGTSFADGTALDSQRRNLYVANRLHNSVAQFQTGTAGDTVSLLLRFLSHWPMGSPLYLPRQLSFETENKRG